MAVAAGARRWLLGVISSAALLIGYFVIGPLAQAFVYQALGLGAVVAVVAGTIRHRPARRSGWWLLALGVLAWALGDALWFADTLIPGVSLESPGAFDAFYLLGYPLLAAGLAVLGTSGSRAERLESILDACMLTVGFALALWFPVIRPALDAGDFSLSIVVSVAYPLGTLVVLTMACGLSWDNERTPALRLLIAAITCTFLADIGYAHLVAHGRAVDGNIVDAGWMVSYALLAAAALHPSMVEIGGSSHRRTRISSPLGIPMVWLIALGAPLVTALELKVNGGRHALVLVGVTAALFALVVMRLARLDDSASARVLRDDLTGLASRRRILDRLDIALRDDLDHTGVLLLDLDHFKTINDAVGHAVGDRILSDVGRRLEQSVRPGSAVGRLGGDEFVIVVPDTEVTALQALAETIDARINEPFSADDVVLHVTASIGMAMARPGDTAEDALAHADVAMRVAKRGGRFRRATYDAAAHQRTTARSQLHQQLHSALDRGEISVAYQPQVHLQTGSIYGVEALARWEHPELGAISPSAFIGLAEENGLIRSIGAYVLRVATSSVAAIDQQLSVAVNVSARQLEDDSFIDEVRSALDEAGLSPGRLVLEITESVLLHPDPIVLHQLQELRRLGVGLALDDFGTGYSSLLQLASFPIDVIKIDQAFVRDLFSSTAKATIVASIIELGRSLGVNVIAEGVETEAARQRLALLGCRFGQGHLWSAPMTARGLRMMLDDATAGDPWQPSSLA